MPPSPGNTMEFYTAIKKSEIEHRKTGISGYHNVKRNKLGSKTLQFSSYGKFLFKVICMYINMYGKTEVKQETCLMI